MAWPPSSRCPSVPYRDARLQKYGLFRYADLSVEEAPLAQFQPVLYVPGAPFPFLFPFISERRWRPPHMPEEGRAVHPMASRATRPTFWQQADALLG